MFFWHLHANHDTVKKRLGSLLATSVMSFFKKTYFKFSYFNMEPALAALDHVFSGRYHQSATIMHLSILIIFERFW
jgi:hypothetical protein